MENIFKEKEIVARELSDICEFLQNRRKDYMETWAVVGKKDEQAKKYNWKTEEYELLWEDEEQTIPKLADEWGNVPKKDEDYTDEDRIRIATIDKVIKMLEKAL